MTIIGYQLGHIAYIRFTAKIREHGLEGHKAKDT